MWARNNVKMSLENESGRFYVFTSFERDECSNTSKVVGVCEEVRRRNLDRQHRSPASI